jgi:hypothetical protein
MKMLARVKHSSFFLATSLKVQISQPILPPFGNVLKLLFTEATAE